jgi:hypothetical protein
VKYALVIFPSKQDSHMSNDSKSRAEQTILMESLNVLLIYMT